MVSCFYGSCRNTEQNRDRLSFTCINTSIWRTKQACLSYLRQEPVSEVILSRRCNLHTTLETILALLEYAFDKGQDNFMINRQCMQLLTMMFIDSRCNSSKATIKTINRYDINSHYRLQYRVIDRSRVSLIF